MIENWEEYSFYRFPESNVSDLIKVRKYLIELARNESSNTVTYTKLRDDCKIDCVFGKNTKVITDILNDIFHYEFLFGRKFLTILVVSKANNSPKKHFFDNVRVYGGNKLNLSDDVFFNYEKNEVSKYWKNEDNYNEFKEFEDLTKQKIEYYKSKLP